MHAVEAFASYFHRSPDQLGPDHIREYRVHLFRDCKLSPRTIEGHTAALRFLFVKTLRRPYMPDQIPFPKCHKRLPTVLSQEEVGRLIECSGSLMQRAMIMTLCRGDQAQSARCRLDTNRSADGEAV
jgi:integrase/recombinase XerD